MWRLRKSWLHGSPEITPMWLRRVATFCDELNSGASIGETLLDPQSFHRSGTTGVAAIQLGHRFNESECDYLAIARRRIAAARPDFDVNLPRKENMDGPT
jgi:hypothetical protein